MKLKQWEMGAPRKVRYVYGRKVVWVSMNCLYKLLSLILTNSAFLLSDEAFMDQDTGQEMVQHQKQSWGFSGRRRRLRRWFKLLLLPHLSRFFSMLIKKTVQGIFASCFLFLLLREKPQKFIVIGLYYSSHLKICSFLEFIMVMMLLVFLLFFLSLKYKGWEH